MNETSQVLIWSFHHILMDGWCLSIFYKELITIYRSLVNNQIIRLATPVPFKNYIDWLEEQDREEGLKYWENYLAGYDRQVSLPKLETRFKSSKHQYRLEEYHFELGEDETSLINGTANLNQVTLNTMFQTVWAILLQRYNNTEDVVFGAVVSGRSSEIEGIEKILGLFINTVPVRIQTKDKQTFTELIKEVQEQAVHSGTRDYLPLSEIQSKSLVKGDLINHIIIFENYPFDEMPGNMLDQDKTGISFRVNSLEVEDQTNYDFNIYVLPGKNLTARFSYNSIVYNSEIVKKVASHLKRVMSQVTNGKDIKVEDIEILPDEEKHRLLVEFNDTKADYPKNKTIVDLFEEQVERTPDKIAVIGKAQSAKRKAERMNRTEGRHAPCAIHYALTYRQLNEKTNQLAYYLSENHNIRPDDPVGIMVDRGQWMIISILGILKSGGAYVPIDPQYPKERKKYMLVDSNAHLLLTTRQYVEPGLFAKEILELEKAFGKTTHHSSLIIHRANAKNIAYVIYTSGSTGKPKGVMIEHGNVVIFNRNLEALFKFESSDIIYGLTTFTFDISVLELICSLVSGIKLALPPPFEYDNFFKLEETVLKENISLLQITPTRLASLIDALGMSFVDNIRILLIGGESLPRRLFNNLRELKNTSIFNVYGPSETTIWSTATHLKHGELNIGSPLINESILILSKDQKLMPIGAAGEICIAGDGLGRGYINRPELTAKKFIRAVISHSSLVISSSSQLSTNDQCPMTNDRSHKPSSNDQFSSPHYPMTPSLHSPIYLTGDFGWWLPAGNINFSGRTDEHINIRGLRIELGEIEYHLSTYPRINEVLVIVKELNGQNRLAVYFVKDMTGDNPDIHIADLRDHLGRLLPGCMIPHHFIALDKIPVTPNGKIDRRSLPDPGDAASSTSTQYIAPRNEIEDKLVEIWEAVLERKTIGINDNFFEIGGNSLKIIRIAGKLMEEFGEAIAIARMFEYPTIDTFAGYLTRQRMKTSEKETKKGQTRMSLIIKP
jgi:fengycin family lipopeptide synthetase D